MRRLCDIAGRFARGTGFYLGDMAAMVVRLGDRLLPPSPEAADHPAFSTNGQLDAKAGFVERAVGSTETRER